MADPDLSLPERRMQALQEFTKTFQKSSKRGKSLPMTKRSQKLTSLVAAVVELDVPQLHADAQRYEALVTTVLKLIHYPDQLTAEEQLLAQRLQEAGNSITTLIDMDVIIDESMGF